MTLPVLHSIGTAVPDRLVTQEEALEHALNALPESDARRIRALYRRSGVRTRSIVVPRTEDQASHGILALREHAPSTGLRMEVYEREVVPLAARAARAALNAAAIPPLDVTHVIAVSCTGFMAPGLDAALRRELGLSAHIHRLIIGFMGCHGALNALSAARMIAAADPSSRILVVCAELCSLHFAADADAADATGGLVANALFADGAAALLVESGAREGWQIVDTLSRIIPDTEEEMGWRIGDRGFRMLLTTNVPDQFGRALPEVLLPWLSGHGLASSEVAWAVHPGGPRILDVVEQACALPGGAMQPSRDVLAAHGNMSSPTVLFILSRLPEEADHAVLLAFGPGLAMEAVLLRRM